MSGLVLSCGCVDTAQGIIPCAAHRIEAITGEQEARDRAAGRRVADQQLGYDKAPDRYMAHGRETIDTIRDSMTDVEFIRYCWGTYIRYCDRLGLKDPVEVEQKKITFYRQMAQHVVDPDGVPDPRAYRADFAPYVRQPFTGTHGVPIGPHALPEMSVEAAGLFIRAALARVGDGFSICVELVPAAWYPTIEDGRTTGIRSVAAHYAARVRFLHERHEFVVEAVGTSPEDVASAAIDDALKLVQGIV